MSPTGHFAMGFAVKGLEPKIPLPVFLAAAYLLDLLYFLFSFAGLDTMAYDPWSHSLLMAIAWSLLTAFIVRFLTRRLKAGVIIGLTVFSHWILDFIVWKQILLTFDPSVTIGVGLYDKIGFSLGNAGLNKGSIIATAIEAGMLIVGIAVYIRDRKKSTKFIERFKT